MSQLTIFENPLDASFVKTINSEDVLIDFLKVKAQYPQAKIYIKTPCPENDITPVDKESSLKLINCNESHYFVVCHAGAPVAWAIASFVVSLAIGVYSFLNMPKNPSGAAGSNNNELSRRTNEQRIGGRVADIFGTVKSIPDLVAQPYTYYSGGQEIEECLMCVGRGFYDISNVQDGDTQINNITGASASFYDPNTPINGDASYIAGEIFNSLPKVAKKSSAIVGQTLASPDDLAIDDEEDNSGIYFTTGGIIQRKNSSINFTDYFKSGDSIQISGAFFGQAGFSYSGVSTINQSKQVSFTTTQDMINASSYKKVSLTGFSVQVVDGETTRQYDLSGTYSVSSISKTPAGSSFLYVISISDATQVNYNWNYVSQSSDTTGGVVLSDSTNTMNLDGAYTISSINSNSITLANASAVNSDWNKLPTIFNGNTANQTSSISLSLVATKWVGWYDIKFENASEALFNIYFPQGLYNTTSKGKTGTGWVDIEIQYRYLDEPTVFIVNRHEERTGNKDTFGISVRIPIPAGKKGITFRLCKRASKQGNAPVTECKIKDAYLLKDSDKLLYPETTMLRTRTIATDSALSVKERQLNCIVTRKLYSYATGVKSAEMEASNSFSDAICEITTNRLIGRRAIDSLDTASLYATESDINQYFGVPIQFNYTFDDAKMSFEETISLIASSIFCDARRESNIIFLEFEKPKDIPVLLFNHRNKVPESEARTATFGMSKDYDGIQLTYTDPLDSWSENEINLPDENITNPQKIDARGVTSKNHAILLAYRAYNKLINQRKFIEFGAYDEADIVARNDLILVSNDTRNQNLSSGSVVSQSGLYIELSEPVPSLNLSFIHLQLPSGKVDSMPVSNGRDNYEVLLSRAPTSGLVMEQDGNISCSQYIITSDSMKDKDLFLITEKSSDRTISAVNYSELYYQNDKDFI